MLEGWTNLHHPHRLIRDNSAVDVDSYPEGYYFTDDITDEAISYLKALRAHDRDRPFFLYLAHGAVHGPLHAKEADIARYRGRYDVGWDAIRERRFARQLERGLFPPGTPMSERNSEPGHEVMPWAEHSEEERSLFARYMEVYAAMIDNVDQNLARLLQTIEQLGDADDTLVIFTSDNGATEEGGATGSRSYFKRFGGFAAMTGWDQDVPRDPDLIGGPQTLVHYPRGWGMASNTPFRLYKSSTHAGGVRVPMIVSVAQRHRRRRPGRAASSVPVRHRTCSPPSWTSSASRPARAGDGSSFAAAVTDSATASTHPEQYSECFGKPQLLPGGLESSWPFTSGEGHTTTTSGSCTTSAPTRPRPWTSAGSRPDKVEELSEAWEQSAWENLVFPLDDGTGLLQLLRRPEDASFYEPVRLLPGTSPLSSGTDHRS